MTGRLLFTLLTLAGLSLSRCAAAPDTGSDRFNAVPITDFPSELGSGFPVAGTVEKGSAEVGEAAPNFAIVLEDGRGTELASLRGRPVVINFWATWCGPCRAEMPELVALHERGSDVIVLEVNVGEELDAIREFAVEYGMTMPVVLDRESAITRAYAVRNMPTSVFITRDGEIATRWAGFVTGGQLEEFVAQISNE